MNNSKKVRLIKIIVFSTLIPVFSEVLLMVLFPPLPELVISGFWGYSFDWYWEVSFLIVILFALKKYKMSRAIFVLFSISCFSISSLFWKIVPNYFDNIGSYYSVEVPKWSITDNLVFGGIYSSKEAADRSYPIQFAEENNYEVRRGKFIFWQTALAKGLEPQGIDSFDDGNKIKLFFIIGPLAIIEIYIRGIFKHLFVVFLLQLLLYNRIRQNVLLLNLSN